MRRDTTVETDPTGVSQIWGRFVAARQLLSAKFQFSFSFVRRFGFGFGFTLSSISTRTVNFGHRISPRHPRVSDVSASTKQSPVVSIDVAAED
jgi:hypothetical protein